MSYDRPVITKAFFDHLRREGVPEEHLAVYAEYFDYFLDRLGEAPLLESDPETLYQLGLAGVEDLDGEEVVATYFQVLQYFIEYWAERWEKMSGEG